MRKQLAIEFRRLLKSPQLYIALAIGIFIAISQIIQTTLPLAEANKSEFYLEQNVIPHSVFTCMLGMGRGSFSWQDSLLKNLIPILAALPFGISYYIDKKILVSLLSGLMLSISICIVNFIIGINIIGFYIKFAIIPLLCIYLFSFAYCLAFNVLCSFIYNRCDTIYKK